MMIKQMIQFPNLYYAKNCKYESDLKGSFQKENKNIAYTAINILRKKEWNIKEKHIISGLKNIKKNQKTHEL